MSCIFPAGDKSINAEVGFQLHVLYKHGLKLVVINQDQITLNWGLQLKACLHSLQWLSDWNCSLTGGNFPITNVELITLSFFDLSRDQRKKVCFYLRSYSLNSVALMYRFLNNFEQIPQTSLSFFSPTLTVAQFIIQTLRNIWKNKS